MDRYPTYLLALPCGVRPATQTIAFMYADFFGFRELPFNNTPDPRFFYSTPDHEEALASLIYAVKERKGFVLLTGEIGAGKTLVTRMMLRHFGARIAFANIHHAVQSPHDLLESICMEFELPLRHAGNTTRLVRLLHDHLLAQFAQNIPVVLVLDEAQNLSVQGFEQLRMIGNLEADDAKLLQIAIVGQPELQRMFLSPQLRQLKQRIFRSFHLPALSREATQGYIRHRLSVVLDAEVEIFDEESITAIYNFTRGLPRIINTVCDNALLSAYSVGRTTIDRPFVESVIKQMLTVGTLDDGVEEQSISSSAVRLSPRRGDWPPAASPSGEEAPEAGKVPVLRPKETPGWHSDTTGLSVSRHEWVAFQREVHAETGEIGKRLTAVERQIRDTNGTLTEARAIHDNLPPLIQQVKTIVHRAETTARELNVREPRLQALAATVKNVARDLRRLLDQIREEALNHSRAENNARAIHHRLVEQSKRSRKLADELGQLASRMTSRVSLQGRRRLMTSEGALPVYPLGGSLIDGISPRTDEAAVREVLPDTRSCLSDGLRNLARRSDPEDTTPAGLDAMSPTHRLAEQVESLLEMIEPAGEL